MKNREIEEARQDLEERAEQLAVSMRYKSEFLANMSHELRTPLNSLLILAKLLADNADANLTPKQVEFAGIDPRRRARTCCSSSTTSWTCRRSRRARWTSPRRASHCVQLVEYVEATFRPMSAEKGLDLSVRVSPGLPADLHTDEQRLRQVLRNLLSNAVKFTEPGSVELVIRAGPDDEVPQAIREQLLEAGSMNDPDAVLIAFSGAATRASGIAASKMQVIFERVQAGGRDDQPQVRRYGPGTVHLAGDRAAAGRRDPGAERARSRFDVHALPAAAPERAAPERLPAGAARHRGGPAAGGPGARRRAGGGGRHPGRGEAAPGRAQRHDRAVPAPPPACRDR
ncbi:Sensor histidine kinase RcsC [Streptomyces tendae]